MRGGFFFCPSPLPPPPLLSSLGSGEADRVLLCFTRQSVTRDHPGSHRKSPTAPATVGSTASAPGVSKRRLTIGFKKTAFPSVGAINNSDPLPKWFGKPACLPGARTEGSPRVSSHPAAGSPPPLPPHPPRNGSGASSWVLKLLSLRWRKGGDRLQIQPSRPLLTLKFIIAFIAWTEGGEKI